MDLINVMTYDLRGSWDGFTGEDSPLLAGPNDKGDYKYFSVVSKDLGQLILTDIFKACHGIPGQGPKGRLRKLDGQDKDGDLF